MFETESSIVIDSIAKQRTKFNGDYSIQINDILTIQVYTNNGETLVDPNNELKTPGVSSKETNVPIKYTIYADGSAHFPMVGTVLLAGLSVNQADSLLALKYSKFYTAPFVKTTILSKRVIVFGPDGGKIIPLDYQSMNLIEVIARYGGIKIDGKANNIRVIRGDLKNPDVQLVNLNTIEGLRAAYLDMQPGDIVYIEPKRRVFKDVLADVLPFASIITSLATLLIIAKAYKI